MGLINILVESTAPVELLYDIAHSSYDFVGAMPNIKEIILLEETTDKTFSRAEWVLDVPLPGRFGRLAWTKDARWRDDAMKCDINLSPGYNGVVKKIDGSWNFIPGDRGTKMKFDMDFLIKHPLVSRRVHDIFDGIMKTNLKNLMIAVKHKAESM